MVVCLGWDRRRVWRAGGDRPAYDDPWCHEAGTVVRPYLVLAHHGPSSGAVTVVWSVAIDGEEPFAAGRCALDEVLGPGTVRELCAAEFEVPPVTRPRTATLRARASVGGESTTNTWRFWFFPAEPWSAVGPVILDDPNTRLADLHRVARLAREVAGEDGGCGDSSGGADLCRGEVVLATRWTSMLDRWVCQGGRAILLADECANSPLRLVPMPFWREAVKVFEPHEAWGDFPHEGWADLQFAGCAPDLALDVSCRLRCPPDPSPTRYADRAGSRLRDRARMGEWPADRVDAPLRRGAGRPAARHRQEYRRFLSAEPVGPQHAARQRGPVTRPAWCRTSYRRQRSQTSPSPTAAAGGGGWDRDARPPIPAE